MRRLVFGLLLWCLVLPGHAAAWTWPVEGAVLRPFSFDLAHPYAAGQHRGIDLGAEAGAPVLVPAAGVVSFAGTTPGNGLTLSVRTADGYTVSLTHLGTLGVHAGTAVAEGSTVATVGPTGTLAYDVPYLYLGIRRTDEENGYVDPLSLLPPRPEPPPLPPTFAGDPAPAPEPAPAPAPEPAPAPAPAPAPDPAPAPAPEPAPTPAPAPAPAPDPAPAPAPGPAPAPAPPAAGDPAPGPVAEPGPPVTPDEPPAPAPEPAPSSLPRGRWPSAPVVVTGGAEAPAPLHGVWTSAASAPAAHAPRPARPLDHRRPVAPAAPSLAPSGRAERPLPTTTATTERRRSPADAGAVLALAAALVAGACCALRGRGGLRPPLTIEEGDALLHHDTDLLRQLDAAHRPRVHDDRGRHPDAASPAARRRDVLPDGGGRACGQGRARSRRAGARSEGVRRPDRRRLAGAAAATERYERLLHQDER